MDEYQIKKINNKDFDLLISLMKDSFGMNVNIDYFKWKFTQNPAGEFIGFVAIHSETHDVAAYYGVIPEKYSLNNSIITLYQSCDTMTHSNHRRKGLFKKLANYCYNDLRNSDNLKVFGFGGQTSTPGFLKMGWKINTYFKYYFIPRLLCYNLYNSKSTEYESINNNHLYYLSELKNLANTNLYKLNDLEFLTWKFSNPLYEYKAITHSVNDKIKCLAIFKFYDQKIEIVHLDNNEHTKFIIQKLKKIVTHKKLKGIIYLSVENLSLIKLGFVNNPFKFGPLSTKIPFITLLNNINNYKWVPSIIEHDAV